MAGHAARGRFVDYSRTTSLRLEKVAGGVRACRAASDAAVSEEVDCRARSLAIMELAVGVTGEWEPGCAAAYALLPTPPPPTALRLKPLPIEESDTADADVVSDE